MCAIAQTLDIGSGPAFWTVASFSTDGQQGRGAEVTGKPIAKICPQFLLEEDLCDMDSSEGVAVYVAQAGYFLGKALEVGKPRAAIARGKDKTIVVDFQSRIAYRETPANSTEADE